MAQVLEDFNIPWLNPNLRIKEVQIVHSEPAKVTKVQVNIKAQALRCAPDQALDTSLKLKRLPEVLLNSNVVLPSDSRQYTRRDLQFPKSIITWPVKRVQEAL